MTTIKTMEELFNNDAYWANINDILVEKGIKEPVVNEEEVHYEMSEEEEAYLFWEELSDAYMGDYLFEQELIEEAMKTHATKRANRKYTNNSKLKNKIRDKRSLFSKLIPLAIEENPSTDTNVLTPKSWVVYKDETVEKEVRKSWYRVGFYAQQIWDDLYRVKNKIEGNTAYRFFEKEVYFTKDKWGEEFMVDKKGNHYLLPKKIWSWEGFEFKELLKHKEPVIVKETHKGSFWSDFQVEGGLFYGKPVHGYFAMGVSLIPADREFIEWDLKKKYKAFNKEEAYNDLFEQRALEQEIEYEECMAYFEEESYYSDTDFYVQRYEGPFSFENEKFIDTIEYNEELMAPENPDDAYGYGYDYFFDGWD